MQRNLDIDITAMVSALYEEILRAYDAGNFNASGKTRSKFELRKVNNAHFQILGANIINILQTGRRPGKVPYNFIAMIEQWARAKGLSITRTQAFFIARKIQREGTRTYRTGGHRDIINEAVKRAVQDNIFALINIKYKNLL